MVEDLRKQEELGALVEQQVDLVQQPALARQPGAVQQPALARQPGAVQRPGPPRPHWAARHAWLWSLLLFMSCSGLIMLGNADVTWVPWFTICLVVISGLSLCVTLILACHRFISFMWIRHRKRVHQGARPARRRALGILSVLAGTASVLLSLALAFLSGIILLFSLPTADHNFIHGGRTYYYGDDGWLDRHLNVWRKTSFLRMTHIGEGYNAGPAIPENDLHDKVDKEALRTAWILMFDPPRSLNGMPPPNGLTDPLEVLGGSEETSTPETTKEQNGTAATETTGEPEVTQATKPPDQATTSPSDSQKDPEQLQGLLSADTIEDAIPVENSSYAVVLVDKAGPANHYLFVEEIKPGSYKAISEIPETAGLIQAIREADGRIELRFRRVDGTEVGLSSVDEGKSWQKMDQRTTDGAEDGA